MIKNKRKKLCLAIIFGGKSAEHEVSIQSARNVLKSINKQKYNILLLGIDKRGGWHLFTARDLLSKKQPFLEKGKAGNEEVISCAKEGKFFIKKGGKAKKIDIVFPILHGPFGEDGTLQGFFKLVNIPFVGAGVLGSAVGMDKDVAKRLLREAKIPVGKFLVYKKYQCQNISFEKVKKNLGLPFFIKPANLGSSVGISKIENKKNFKKALKLAFSYDNKILIEECIQGREIECSVLGNENPIASIPGEIIVHNGFYSYKAKYLDKNGATLSIPARLPESMVKKIQKM